MRKRKGTCKGAVLAIWSFQRVLNFIRNLAVVCVVFLFSIVNADDLVFRTVKPGQFAQLGRINAIAQDKKGFMWFGGVNGLARFDGYRLKIFRQANSNLPSDRINDVHVTADGYLWVATQQGVSRYDADIEDFKTSIHPDSSRNTNPFNNFFTIEEGLQRRLWLGGADGLYIYDRDTRAFNKIQLNIFGVDNIENEAVLSIVKDGYSYIWAATKSMGIILLSTGDDKQSLFSYVYKNGEKLPAPIAKKLYLDSNNSVWLQSEGGELFRFSRSANRFEYVDLLGCEQGVRAGVPCNKMTTLFSSLLWGENGVLYASSDRGLKTFYPEAGKFTLVEKDISAFYGLNASVIFRDSDHNLWFAYPTAKVDIAKRRDNHVVNIPLRDLKNASGEELEVLSVAESKRGEIWLGTNDGLKNLERVSGRILSSALNLQLGISNKNVTSIVTDKNENLWLTIQGLGVGRISKDTGKHKIFPTDSVGVEPKYLLGDSKGDIWLASELGLFRYYGDKDEFVAVVAPEKIGDESYVEANLLYEDSSQKLWLASDSGLYEVDKNQNLLLLRSKSFGQESESAAVGVKTLFEDSRGNFWLSVSGAGIGIYDREASVFSRPEHLSAMSGDMVSQIVEDESGKLWFSTDKGLMRFDQEFQQLRFFGETDGFTADMSNARVAVKLGSGEMLFAMKKSLAKFEPSWFDSSRSPDRLTFTAIKGLDKPIDIAKIESPLETSVLEKHALVLDHRYKAVRIEFSALNYFEPELTHYAYKLEGSEDQWQSLGTNSYVVLTNLTPGDYVLHLNSDNGYGKWDDMVKTLGIKVKAPWWKSWWAFLIYLPLVWFLLVILGFAILKIRAYSREKGLNVRLKELDKLKDEFLANTSQELRLPLNGMVGIAEALKHQLADKISKEELKKLDVILDCGHSLFTIIDDILDYSKLTHGSLKLNKESVDLYQLTGVVFSLLETLVGGKPTILVNALSSDLPRVYADENRLAQILINLVGNAIKFSEKGYVTVGASYSDGRVLISVEDNGVGIAPDRLETIFEPFHHEGEAEEGMGLGLFITRQLIQLHGGDIQVKSVKGIGTEVLFDLEVSHEAVESQDKIFTSGKLRGNSLSDIPREQNVYSEGHQMFLGESMPELIAAPEDSHKFVVLIVDDDPVNRMILQGVLAIHDYQVLEAENGEQALHILSKNKSVNLVILDIMMPGISGYETCAKIRESYNIHELPVIFLSARNSDKDLFNGYNAGGNEFIIKPVTRSNLLPKVAVQVCLQQVANRKKPL